MREGGWSKGHIRVREQKRGKGEENYECDKE